MLGSSGTAGDGVFAGVKRASLVAGELRIEPVPVQDALVDQAAEELARASGALRQQSDESITKPVGQAFGALLELVSWFAPPTPADIGTYLVRLGAILGEVNRAAPWAPSEATQALRAAIQHMTRAASEPFVGWSRLEALVFALDALNAAGRRVAVATRSATAAAALRDQLPEYLRSVPIFGSSLIPSDSVLDTVIVASWLKSEGMTRLLNLYLAADVRVIAAPFEQKWLSGLTRRRQATQRRVGLDRSTKLSILGLTPSDAIADDIDSGVTPPSTESAPESFVPSEELDKLEGWTRRRRKGQVADDVDDHDRRDARYVGFVGETYAYVTVGRSLPVVTDLVRGVSAGQAKVPLTTIDRLRPGEFVLFRDQGDRDVISLFAEHELGSTLYKKRRAVAERWRAVLTGIGSSHGEISRRLREVGISKHPATIRSWLLDSDKIGPGSRADLAAIARAAGQPDTWVSEVWDAIADIRGAHIAAGQKLSQFLLSELPKKLRAVGETETRVDLTFGHAWVVEIDEIGEIETRSYTEVNRLLWE